MIKLRAGDFFCVESPSWMGKAIAFVERMQAKDGRAEYNHAGIITDECGTTIEARWKIGAFSLDDYKGKKILIGRWRGMTPESYWKGIDTIKDDLGDIYPAWRLFLFMFPSLARWISSGKFTVCSELVCKFLLGAGFSDIGVWPGQNPDDVADMIKKWDAVDVVYEGVWPPKSEGTK